MELSKKVMCLLERVFAPSNTVEKFHKEPISLQLTAKERTKLYFLKMK